MEKVIVVGTNHAGTHAVVTLANDYKESVKVTTYDRNNNISFLGCGMALWIGKVIGGADGLFYSNPEQLKSLGADVYMEHDITAIDFDKKEVTVKDLNTGREFIDTYDKLILALGSWPITPKIPGIELENVIYAKLFQHAQKAIEIIENDNIKKVAVVGAGYIGVELAEAFIQNGKEVVLISNEDVVNNYYDSEFTTLMHEAIESNNVVMATNETLEEIIGENNKVKKVVTDKNSYDVDLVLLSVGFKPLTEIVADSKLEFDNRGAIVVNNNQETSIPGVYAIGDCATIYNNASGQKEHIALATNAVRTGIVAAHNAAGTPFAMQGVQGSNAIHVFGQTLCSTGLTQKGAQKLGIEVDSVTVTDNIRPEFMCENDEVTLKVIWRKDNKEIIGAQIASKADITLANHFFSLAIQEKYTIDKLALLDLFFLPHFNKPVNFITLAGLEALKKL
ncbi:MAG: FAD-dependent oxidoreductase [Bacilli bacterium]